MRQKFLLPLLAALILSTSTVWAQPQQKAYLETARLVEKYDVAIQRGDLQRALKAQEEALNSWYALEPEQKRQLEAEFGSMYAWLQAGEDYESNNVRPRRRGR